MSVALRIAGVDEVGRGPLAGPVVAAAIILPADHGVRGIADSKKLSARRRQIIAAQLRERCPLHAVVCLDAARIDEINILQASLEAMREAVLRLPQRPDHVHVDGKHLPDGLPCPGTAIVGGDASDLAIAAASILAKVARDAIMDAYDAHYPQYGFARNKGYPTAEHRLALQQYGPCPLHRMSFAPVRLATRLELAL